MMRNLLVKVFNPWVWRSAASSARKLREFAAAEAGSRLDMMLACASTDSTHRSALYLRHALDESRHADAFAEAACLLDAERCSRISVDSDGLFESLSETEFLAFVHLGERRGRRQFEIYRDFFSARNDPKAELFRRIVRDERMHEAYSRKELIRLAGSEAAAKRLVAKMHLWEFYRNQLRRARTLTGILYHFCMYLLYLASFPAAMLVRWFRSEEKGWVRPEP